MGNDFSRDLLGEAVASHSHPAVLALVIMGKYPTIAAAKAPTPGSTYAAALTDQDVPGTGGSVWMALDLIDAAQVVGVEQALALIEKRLGAAESPGEKAGFEQGLRFRERFKARFQEWQGASAVY